MGDGDEQSSFSKGNMGRIEESRGGEKSRGEKLIIYSV